MSTAPIQQPRNTATDFATLQFIFEQLLSRVQTSMPVRVMAVTNAGELAPVGRVDVLPLVNQVTGDGQAVPHATIFNVPYSRWQGGTNAVILDPQVGDIGICIFASRDISAVKADPQHAADNGGANPGSARTYNFADGVYVAGILNGVPTRYVQFNDDGITLVDPAKITLDAPLVIATGDVIASGVSLVHHTHGGVTPGVGSTGPPI